MADLYKPSTIIDMVEAYQQAETLYKEGFVAFQQALSLLNYHFGSKPGRFNPFGHYPDPDEFGKRWLESLPRKCWQGIVDRLEIKKLMTLEDANAVDQRLKGEVPPITVEQVTAMINQMADSMQGLLEKAVSEAYESLRPQGSKLATNVSNRFTLSDKVILEHYASALDHLNWIRHDLYTIDLAFHLLDGKGIPKGYHSPLADAVAMGGGETEYFIVKNYKNGNVHLTFKRPDLVEQFNLLCADRSALPDGSKRTMG